MGDVTISATTANACGCCGNAAPPPDCCYYSLVSFTGDNASISATGYAVTADTAVAGGAPGLDLSYVAYVNLAVPALVTVHVVTTGSGNSYNADVLVYDESSNPVNYDSRTGSPDDFTDEYTITNAGCYQFLFEAGGSQMPGTIDYLTQTGTISSNANINCNTFVEV